MARKVFLSFLGTGFYNETYYFDENKGRENIEPTRFIQVATLKNYAQDFSSEDKILIFTTEGALLNWNDNTHIDKRNNDEKVFYEGLETCINQLNLKAELKNIHISKGNSTEQIWEIFKIVFDKIEPNDELIFDITHGFRSLPMLNMVLINYAKLLKNVSVSGVYYGAYEAKKTFNNKMFSPIWNLIDFEQLQEWTNAAQLFLKAGSAEKLSNMMQEREIVGNKEIRMFSQEILTNRGINLTKGTSALAIKNILFEGKNKDIHPVVKPIFELIENQFYSYQEDNVLNGLYAVKWCIEHDLIQQGYTLMSEFLPTYILNYIGEEFGDKDARNTINGFLGIKGKKENFRFNDKIKDRQIVILDKALSIPYFKKLCQRNKSINPQNRDDINHGGFRKKPKDYETFKEELQDKYEKLKDVILRIENEK